MEFEVLVSREVGESWVAVDPGSHGYLKVTFASGKTQVFTEVNV